MSGTHDVCHGPRRLQHTHRAADVVRRTRSPCIAVRADDHQLVRQLAAADDTEGVVNQLRALGHAVVGHAHAGLHRPGAHVVAERKSTLPSGRHVAAANAGQQLARVAVRDRHDGDARQRHALGREPRRVRRTRVSRRGRVSRAIEHAAALDAVPVAHRTFGIDVAARISIGLRIAVDEQCYCAMPLRFARLDAAERAAIARDGDAPLHGHPQRVEPRIVLDQPVVHIDDLARRLADTAVAVHGRVLPLRGRRITGDRWLPER